MAMATTSADEEESPAESGRVEQTRASTPREAPWAPTTAWAAALR
jgi:hypothetical protein